MQVKSFQAVKRQGKTDSYDPNPFAYLNENKSPASINKSFSNGFLSNQDILANGKTKTTIQKESSFSGGIDAYSINQSSKRFSYDPLTNANSYIPQKPNPQYNSSKIIPIDRALSTNYLTNPSKQSTFQKTLQYNLLKIQSQSLRTQNSKHKQTIKKLRQQLQSKVQMLSKFNQLMKIKYNELKQVKAQSQEKDKIIENFKKSQSQQLSQQQSKRIKQQLFITKKQYDELFSKVYNMENQNFKNQVYQMKISKLYDQLQEQKTKQTELILENSRCNQKIKQLEEQLSLIQYMNQKNATLNKIQEFQKIQLLFKNLETPSSGSPSKSNKNQANHLTAFDEALKVQMKQIEQLKQTIETSQQVIQKLKDNLISSRKELQVLRGEMKIMDLKYNTQRKKLIMQYRLQIHDKDNDINTAFKKYKTLQQKYKTSLVDIKAKDEFLKQHLVGRATDGSVQQYIESVLKEYTDEFQNMLSLKSENKELLQKLQRYRRYQSSIDGQNKQINSTN